MKEKILVVDNNPVILRLLTHFLQKEGYSVKSADDGLSALEVLQSFHPDILIVDLIMPQIAGDKLCRIVSNQSKFDNTLIVILSSVAAEENIDFVSLGADACVAKGPAKEMLQNILTVFDHAKHGNYTALSQHIFGIDDVHERQITKELLESKREFETTLQYMTDGFITLTSSAKIISANPAATQLFQTTEDKLLSTPFVDHFDEKYKEIIAEQLDKINDQVSELGEEEPIILYEKYILIKFIPVLGQVAKSFIIFISDITKRKIDDLVLRKYKLHLEELVEKRTCELEKINENLQYEIAERHKTEKELERAGRQWENTFNAISDFVSVHDKDMDFVKVNKALADFFGKSSEELIGRKCFEVMHGTQEPWLNCPHVTSMEKGKTVTEEINDPHIGIPLLVTCSPCKDIEGNVMGTVHISRDISLEISSKEEKEKLIAELQEALSKVKLLSGFLPICASCKKIRDDKGYWNQIETYIEEHSTAQFSHAMCEECSDKLYGGEDWYKKAKKNGKIRSS